MKDDLKRNFINNLVTIINVTVENSFIGRYSFTIWLWHSDICDVTTAAGAVMKVIRT